MIKFRNGFDIRIAGAPSMQVTELPVPSTLCLPLTSQRLEYTKLLIREGVEVKAGQVLAVAPKQYGLPLIAPLAGTVRLRANRGSITLENAHAEDQYMPFHGESMSEYIPIPECGDHAEAIHQVIGLGGWTAFSDALTGNLPDPSVSPGAVMVVVPTLEPFKVRGEVVLSRQLRQFLTGIEKLRELSGKPIHVIIPRETSDFVTTLADELKTLDWVVVEKITSRYPADNPCLLARLLGFKGEDGPVWSLKPDGVVAVEQILSASRPVVSNWVAVGGPGVPEPQNYIALHGTLFSDIPGLEGHEGTMKIISGGVLTGRGIPEEQAGIDVETRGLTVVPVRTDPEFLAFVMPGEDRISFSRCFLSALRLHMNFKTTTAVRGEKRACIACGYCEGVCPAGLMPQVLHRFLYADQIDEAEGMALHLCLDCGLCTYVCPCKIDLQKQFAEAKETILLESAEI